LFPVQSIQDRWQCPIESLIPGQVPDQFTPGTIGASIDSQESGEGDWTVDAFAQQHPAAGTALVE